MIKFFLACNANANCSFSLFQSDSQSSTIHNLFFAVTEETEIDAVKIWQKMQILLFTIKATIA